MEIVRERLEREFDLSLIATAPSVEYIAHLTNGDDGCRRQPVRDARRRRTSSTSRSRCLQVTILAPAEYIGHGDGAVPDPAGRAWSGWSTCRPERVELVYRIPLAEVVVDFFDQLKSRTKGYASLDYEPAGIPGGEPGQGRRRCSTASRSTPSRTIVHRAKADDYGRKMTAKLRELIPRQLFDVPIQAAIGGRIIARETVKAKRKDVLAKCYGGDITRKRKLLERQKEGKKRMKSIGRVEVPQEAFVSALRLDD